MPNAVAQAYIDYRGQLAETRRQSIISGLETERDTLRTSLSDVNARIADEAPGSPETADAEANRTFYTAELTAVINEITSLQAIDTVGGVVLTSALDRGVEKSPSLTLYVATGAAFGLAAGMALAFWINFRRTRGVVHERDLESIGSVDVLARITSVDGTVEDRGSTTCTWHAYRILAQAGSGPTRIALLDLTNSETPSAIAFRLAASFVAARSPVTLVLIDWPGNSSQIVAASRGKIQEALGRTPWANTCDPCLLVPTLATDQPRQTSSSWSHRLHRGTSVRLEALRAADDVILLIAEGETRSADLSEVLEASVPLGFPRVGVIMLSRSIDRIECRLAALSTDETSEPESLALELSTRPERCRDLTPRRVDLGPNPAVRLERDGTSVLQAGAWSPGAGEESREVVGRFVKSSYVCSRQRRTRPMKPRWTCGSPMAPPRRSDRRHRARSVLRSSYERSSELLSQLPPSSDSSHRSQRSRGLNDKRSHRAAS